VADIGDQRLCLELLTDVLHYMGDWRCCAYWRLREQAEVQKVARSSACAGHHRSWKTALAKRGIGDRGAGGGGRGALLYVNVFLTLTLRDLTSCIEGGHPGDCAGEGTGAGGSSRERAGEGGCALK
jgi:hypothetical protein